MDKSNIFNTDEMEINITNKKYFIFLIIIIFIIIGLLTIKKDYYYENNLLQDEGSFMLLAEKDVVNTIKDKRTILINGIKNNYNINKIIDNGNVCYIDIKIDVDIENISSGKYKILLRKETFFEFIIRVIKKISWKE